MKLELRQEQRLSQRQIQSLHLLQMGWMELENTLSQLAEENPLIDLDASHFYHADVSPSAAYPGSTYRPPLEDEAPSPIDLASTDGGLHETLPRHLQRQIAALPISKGKKQVLFYLSECLDDDGYLRATTEELTEDTGLAPLLLRRCMNALQALEPAGVGAQSLKQCLRLQLERTGSDETALRIVQDFLPSLAKGRYRQIAEAIGVPEKEVRRASDAIRQLEPRPGLAFCRPERSPTIRPDIYIVDRGGTFVCDEDRLYRPTVHVNVYYRKLYLTTENAELKQYLKEKLRHAESILYALEQRGSTLLLCARYIAAQQQEYFRRGPSFLTPMTMTSAASALGVSLPPPSAGQCGISTFKAHRVSTLFPTSSPLPRQTSVLTAAMPHAPCCAVSSNKRTNTIHSPTKSSVKCWCRRAFPFHAALRQNIVENCRSPVPLGVAHLDASSVQQNQPTPVCMGWFFLPITKEFFHVGLNGI